MKREIKFRGKRSKDDEWVYGGLVYRLPKHPEIIINEYITHQNGECEDNFVFYQDIYEDTIGQFTGLYDKNGREIYEGDIVYQRTYYGNRPCVVRFEEGTFMVGYHEGSSTKHTPMLIKNSCVVIGNIHDNQELIKEEQQ